MEYIEHRMPGEDFEEYLKQYRHGTMILNIRASGSSTAYWSCWRNTVLRGISS